MDSNLKTSLINLQASLAAAGPIDAELHTLLRELDADIQQLLLRREHAPAVSTTYGLAERTQEVAAKFAAQHPKLESSLRELGNILSSMGI